MEEADPFYTKWKTAQEVAEHLNVNGEGRTAIVTGSNSGIGYESALALCNSGYTVISCCRSQTKAQATMEKLTAAATGSGRCTPGVVDLGDLNSVRTFVASLQDKPIHLILNNAGIMQLPTFQQSAQQYEMQFAVNFLGPWLLVELLKPHLRLAATAHQVPSRVVNVASSAHYTSSFDLMPNEDMIGDPTHAEQAYTTGWNEYATSKLYQILHARHLAEQERGNNIVSFSLHPGVIATGLSRNAKCCSFTRLLYCFPKALYCCCCCCQGWLRTSVDQGAASSVRACVDPALVEVSGCYLGEDCQPKEPRLPANFDFEKFKKRCKGLCSVGTVGRDKGTDVGGEKV